MKGRHADESDLEEIAVRAIAIHQYRKRVEATQATRDETDPVRQCQEGLLAQYEQRLAALIDCFTQTGDRHGRPARIPARRHRKARRHRRTRAVLAAEL